jgi:hypothetical protein
MRPRCRGVLAEGLPQLLQGALGQLRRNRYIVTSQEGTGVRVGLGARTRGIAAKWGIELPESAGR